MDYTFPELLSIRLFDAEPRSCTLEARRNTIGACIYSRQSAHSITQLDAGGKCLFINDFESRKSKRLDGVI